jgi:glycine betaine catabolism B
MDTRYQVEVINIVDETKNVKTFRFKVDKNFQFLPGQFVFLYVNIEGKEVKRPYSIGSSPKNKENVELTLELVPGGLLTSFFHNFVKIGDKFEISQAQGSFIYTDEIKEIVLIAGGSGIVPMRSIIKYCIDKNLDTKINLFYSAKTFDDIIYRDDLFELGNKSNIKIFLTLTREVTNKWDGLTGRISIDMLLDNLNRFEQLTYYLCGPMNMVRTLAKNLKEKDIKRQQIKRELWGI